MYHAFCFSAFVSLAAHLSSSSSPVASSSPASSSPPRPPLLPRRAPHFALAGAFALEFALFAFHLEGTALDVRAHSLLAVTVGCCAALSAVEALSPDDSPVAVEVAAAKALATWLQGCWFVALAEILFKGRRSMDPRYHGSVMFLPAILGFLALASGCLWVAAFVVGGVVPPQDYEALTKAGCEAIFPPGTVIAEAAENLLKTLHHRLGHDQQAAE